MLFDIFNEVDKVKNLFNVEKLKGNYAENVPAFMVKENLMKTDIKETKTYYIIECEIPGAKKGNIAVNYLDNIITIKVVWDEIDKTDYIRQERVFRAYSRNFYMDNIVPEDINVRYKKGILTITAPKEVIQFNEERISIDLE